MLRWLWDFIADEFLVVSLPRALVLRNRRLGIFYKIVQSLFLIVVLLYVLYARIIMYENTVEAWAVNLWREKSPAQRVVSHTLPDCQDPSTYSWKADSTFSYMPTACKALPNEEVHFITQNKLFLATFIDDTLVWDGTGETCGAASQQTCQQNAEAVYEEADGHCSCKFHEHFTVKDAEEQRLRFSYGYELDRSYGKRADVWRDGFVSTEASSGPQHDLTSHRSTLVTRFLALDGTECTFGGRSKWQHSDAVGGLSGTLQELLACAGVTLDSNPAKPVGGTLSSPPHLRTMGFKLILHVELSQNLFGEMTSEVRIEATPTTTVTWKDDIQPSASSRMGTVNRRLRRAHGVALDVFVKGTMYTFSWYRFVRGFVDILVLMQIPSSVVQFVAMYLMGVTSEVYRNTARTKLNIFGKFHNTVSKLMLAEVAFRGLVGDYSNGIEQLQSLTLPLLLSRLQDLFLGQSRTGELKDEEIVRMACAVFVTMDTDSDGQIGCREFIESCTNDGELTMQRMAQFFHRDTGIRSLRRFLDDTHVVAHRVARKSEFYRSPTSTTVDSQELPRRINSYMEQVSRANTPNQSVVEGATDVPLDSAKISQVCKDSEATSNGEKRPCEAADGRLERALANLERRLQMQEDHCERALGVMREALDQEQLTSWPRNHRDCPMLIARAELHAAAPKTIDVDKGSLAQQAAAALSQEDHAVGNGSVLQPLKNDPQLEPMVDYVPAMGLPSHSVRPSMHTVEIASHPLAQQSSAHTGRRWGPTTSMAVYSPGCRRLFRVPEQGN